MKVLAGKIGNGDKLAGGFDLAFVILEPVPKFIAIRKKFG